MTTPAPLQSPAFIWITERAQMAQVASAVAEAAWVALDTEANSMFVYRERICLIQINAGGRLFLLDPLAIDPTAADPATFALLKPLLEDPDRTLYLHGGEYDVGSFKRDYGITLAGVFDTQQAASLLGWEKTGYGAVVENLCGVVLPKDHAQYDWGTRPLDPAAVQYALDDVIHLPQVAERLKEAVLQADLEEELAIANRAVMDITWSGGFEPAGFWRLKGIRDVPVQALGILFALYQWRDAIARTANKPAGRMLNTELMFAIARQAPTNFQLLKRLGLKGWFMSEHGEAMMDIIRTARAQPPELPPRPIPRDVPPEEEQRERRLKDWRRTEAETRTRTEGRTVPLQVVLPARALEYLKRHGAVELSSAPQLGAKRIARYGDKLRQLCG